MELDDQDVLIDLIARCAIKDQMALKALYGEVSGYLNAIAFRILKSDDLANEALQEAFIQIWENAPSYRPHLSKPRTWLSSIVRYRSLDKLEKEKRHMHVSVSVYDENETDVLNDIPASPATSPEAQFSSGQLSAHIIDCLATLNEKVKLSIHLAYLEGYSREEIAKKLDSNANTVKSWLHRGSERLKRCLQEKNQTIR